METGDSRTATRGNGRRENDLRHHSKRGVPCSQGPHECMATFRSPCTLSVTRPYKCGKIRMYVNEYEFLKLSSRLLTCSRYMTIVGIASFIGTEEDAIKYMHKPYIASPIFKKVEDVVIESSNVTRHHLFLIQLYVDAEGRHAPPRGC